MPIIQALTQEITNGLLPELLDQKAELTKRSVSIEARLADSLTASVHRSLATGSRCQQILNLLDPEPVPTEQVQESDLHDIVSELGKVSEHCIISPLGRQILTNYALAAAGGVSGDSFAPGIVHEACAICGDPIPFGSLEQARCINQHPFGKSN